MYYSVKKSSDESKIQHHKQPFQYLQNAVEVRPGHDLAGDDDHEGAPTVPADVRPRLPEEPHKLLPGDAGASANTGATSRAAPDAAAPPAARNGYLPNSPGWESICGG